MAGYHPSHPHTHTSTTTPTHTCPPTHTFGHCSRQTRLACMAALWQHIHTKLYMCPHHMPASSSSVRGFITWHCRGMVDNSTPPYLHNAHEPYARVPTHTHYNMHYHYTTRLHFTRQATFPPPAPHAHTTTPFKHQHTRCPHILFYHTCSIAYLYTATTTWHYHNCLYFTHGTTFHFAPHSSFMTICEHLLSHALPCSPHPLLFSHLPSHPTIPPVAERSYTPPTQTPHRPHNKRPPLPFYQLTDYATYPPHTCSGHALPNGAAPGDRI